MTKRLCHNDEDWEMDPLHEDYNKSWKGATFRIGWNKDIS